jgi:FkbM family methyltransferase
MRFCGAFACEGAELARIRAVSPWATLSLVRIDRTYTLRSGLAKGLKKRGGIGLRQTLGLTVGLSSEDVLLQSLDFAGQRIFDIGGFEGIHTIFFADRAGPDGQVVTFEPDPVNYQKILENVGINDLTNVVVLNLGVGDRPGHLEFAYPRDRGRGSALIETLEHYKSDSHTQRVTLPVTSIDSELQSQGRPAPDFVKVDVEGLELQVLEGMVDTVDRFKPRIFLEIHGWSVNGKEANSQRVVAWLEDHGYSITHVESGQEITMDNYQVAREGHLYCI